jgi:hypothetical protein
VTLNMAGVKVTSLRLTDLRPATISSTLSRQFFQMRAQVSKFYNNARFVYELESKMRELRRDTDTPPTTQPKKAEPSSRNEGTQGTDLRAEESSAHSAPGTSIAGVHRTASIARKSAERGIQGTEVAELKFASHKKAGPRRNAENAGCDGRSLA